MKYTVTVFLLLSLCGLLNNKSFAQKEPLKYGNILPDGKNKRTYWEAGNNKNEVQAVFSGLFLFYKSFISSQDLTVCTFTPSCSEYGILAVKEHGVLKGGFLTMDRLTRCNGLSPEKYEVDKAKMLLKDDPRDKHIVPIIDEVQ